MEIILSDLSYEIDRMTHSFTALAKDRIHIVVTKWR